MYRCDSPAAITMLIPGGKISFARDQGTCVCRGNKYGTAKISKVGGSYCRIYIGGTVILDTKEHVGITAGKAVSQARSRRTVRERVKGLGVSGYFSFPHRPIFLALSIPALLQAVRGQGSSVSAPSRPGADLISLFENLSCGQRSADQESPRDRNSLLSPTRRNGYV